MTMRVAIGGISHETNTFSSIQTTLEHFQQRALLRGTALVEYSRGIATTLGGIVDAAGTLGWEIVPVLFASAVPSGRVRRQTFEALAGELIGGIASALPLDGVLLALHGAMVAEGVDDAEGELLRRLRRRIGYDIPLVLVLDSHATLTPSIAALADVIIGYDTYPHIDTYARGSEAVQLLARLHRGEFRPTRALRQIPLLAPLPTQWTAGPTPMRDLMRMALEAEQAPGVVSVMLAGGFPYADIRDAGMAVLVTTDNDPALASAIAVRLAEACWERRELFRADLLPIEEAVLAVRGTTRLDGPIVLADVGDNPGAGAACDGTALLDALLRQGARRVALAVIADPQSVARADGLGAGSGGPFRLGGKTDHLHGPTLEVWAQVRSVGEVSFANLGPMGAGARTHLGRTAVLEVGPERGVEVVVTEQRVQVLEPELFRAVGIIPEQRRALVVKSSVHFRAAFEPMAGGIIEVDTPGLASPDLPSFPYRRVRRPIWPLDPEMDWHPQGS